jgi:NADH:ubiquinone oxidoreductase subunit D
LLENDYLRGPGRWIRERHDPYEPGRSDPALRGHSYDVPKPFRISVDTFDFTVPVRTEGDVFARYTLKLEEMRESVKICRQALSRISPFGLYDCRDYRIVPPPKDRVYTEMEALIQHFLLYSQGFNVPKGECYVPSRGRGANTGSTSCRMAATGRFA